MIRRAIERKLGPKTAGLLRYRDGILVALLIFFKSLDFYVMNRDQPEESHVMTLVFGGLVKCHRNQIFHRKRSTPLFVRK